MFVCVCVCVCVCVNGFFALLFVVNFSTSELGISGEGRNHVAPGIGCVQVCDLSHVCCSDLTIAEGIRAFFHRNQKKNKKKQTPQKGVSKWKASHTGTRRHSHGVRILAMNTSLRRWKISFPTIALWWIVST